MSVQATDILWNKLRSHAGGYSLEAFAFVQEGLRFTVEQAAEREDMEPSEGRHVSGQELCLGLREYAVREYGLLAKTVLHSWGVRRTEDFGRIVFALVETGILRKSEEDSLGDFTGIFDFEEAFGGTAVGLC